MDWIFEPQAWIALATLTVLEIVLGIDNIVFISILVGRLPAKLRQKGRIIGLSLAMVTRILLLLTLSWMIKLTKPIFTILTNDISGRDIILIVGGLFLLAKSTTEIHNSLEGTEIKRGTVLGAGFISIITQIALIDIVFSLDSVITAIGIAKHIEVMVLAIVIAVAVMIAAAGSIGDFVDKHPTIKMLALSFLVLIGVALIADGLDLHIPKGYIYFAMAFSVGVEILNMKIKGTREKPLSLYKNIEGNT
jgi:predicted tellurium resistance membrane protein TerC